MATLTDCHLLFGLPDDQKRRANVVFHHDLQVACGSRLRFRFRNEDFAQIFVRTQGVGIRHFLLEWRDTYWFVDPQWEQGANQTP